MDNQPILPQETPAETKRSKHTFWIILVSVVFLIAAAYVVFKFQNNSITGEVINVPEKFEFKGYTLIDEAKIKSECPYIRVGRCDLIGGEFGETCWSRGAEFKYLIQGISTKNLKCTAKVSRGSSQPVNLGGTEIFEATSEKDIYKLTYKIDIRQNNEVEVCCQRTDTSEEICTPKFDVIGIC